MKRARRNTNTRKRRRLQREMRRRRRKRNPGPRKPKWMSWRTSWGEEPDRSKETTATTKNYKSSGFMRKGVRSLIKPPGSLTCMCIKQHLQAIHYTRGYHLHPGKTTKSSGTCLFPLIYPRLHYCSLPFQTVRTRGETHVCCSES